MIWRRNAIFGHVARLPDNTVAHQVELSVGRPQTLHGNVPQVDHVPNGPTNSAAITTMSPLRLCGGKPSVAVTRERRYGPSRLRVNDDDDTACRSSEDHETSHAPSFMSSKTICIRDECDGWVSGTYVCATAHYYCFTPPPPITWWSHLIWHNVASVKAN